MTIFVSAAIAGPPTLARLRKMSNVAIQIKLSFFNESPLPIFFAVVYVNDYTPLTYKYARGKGGVLWFLLKFFIYCPADLALIEDLTDPA
jgi:hypothetical protein